MASAKRPSNHLLGLGLDAQDRHKRITRGEGFDLVGGSEETHERMTEMAIKTSEDLSRKGRTIAEAHPAELTDLLRKHNRGA
ncbi:MAG: hypothetical protein CK541_03085 [Opitutia bacterium]|nr:MAG: hypothetical protein CK541_03085 [Opitutae bacterium]